MNIEQFNSLIDLIDTMYYVKNKEKYAAFLESHLLKYDYLLVLNNFDKYNTTQNAKYAPKLGDLIGYIKDLDDEAEEAWLAVLELVNNPALRKLQNLLDNATKKALKVIGGLQYLDNININQLSFCKKDYKSSYRSYKNNNKKILSHFILTDDKERINYNNKLEIEIQQKREVKLLQENTLKERALPTHSLETILNNLDIHKLNK